MRGRNGNIFEIYDKYLMAWEDVAGLLETEEEPSPQMHGRLVNAQPRRRGHEKPTTVQRTQIPRCRCFEQVWNRARNV